MSSLPRGFLSLSFVKIDIYLNFLQVEFSPSDFFGT